MKCDVMSARHPITCGIGPERPIGVGTPFVLGYATQKRVLRKATHNWPLFSSLVAQAPVTRYGWTAGSTSRMLRRVYFLYVTGRRTFRPLWSVLSVARHVRCTCRTSGGGWDLIARSGAMHLFRAIGRRIHCALWTEVRISLGYGAHMYLLRVREEGARNCAAKLSKSKFNSANCIDYLRPNRDGKLSRDLLWGDYGRSYPYADPLICRRSLHLSET